MNNPQIYGLHFKWTVSRNRDTYGYNICTLYVDGQKVSSCNGGGYDMQGTCLAEWLQSAYQDRLMRLFAADIASVTAADFYEYQDKGKTKRCLRKSAWREFYGAFLLQGGDETTPRIGLDGRCGFSSIERIASAVGIGLKWNPESDKRKNDTWYTAIDNGYPQV